MPDSSPSAREGDDELFERAHAGDKAARDEICQRYLPLARNLAHKYTRHEELREDLEQVASLALVRSVDRFDPEVGSFKAFAIPTIIGEIKRHFRDKSWGLHVPRSAQENFLTVNEAIASLSTELGRSATPRDVAESTGLDLEEVMDALAAGNAYSPAALETPLGGTEEDGLRLADTLGSEDRHYDYVEFGAAFGPAFADLPEREQRILHMRFFEDLTQSEIAAKLGISQMHVSRLLRRTLAELREAFDSNEPEQPARD